MDTPLRALIVDDSASDAAAVVRHLQAAGFDVSYTRVETAPQMCVALAQERWDVALSAFEMREFSGSAALATLRDSGLDIPFIVVSGVITDAEGSALMRRGAHDYVMKSNLARLAPAVEREIRDACGRFERQRALGALRASRQRHVSAVESAMDGYMAAGRDTRLLEVNKALCDLTGYSSDELLRLAVCDLEARESAQDVAAHGEAMVRVGGDRFESQWRRKDGRIVDVELSITYRAEDGGEFLCFVRDISARKRSDAELRRNAEESERSRAVLLSVLEDQRAATAELRASEERWKFALEGAGDGVWDIDLQTETLVYSKRYLEMYGFGDGEIGNYPDEWMARVHPEDLTNVLADRQAYLDGDTPQYTSEHRQLCRDGSWKWVLSRGMVVARDPQGRPLRMIGTHSDISARKRADAELREMEAREKLASERMNHNQRLASLGEMAAAISHEVNQPLMAIATYGGVAERLLRAPTLDLDKLNEAITAIKEDAMRAGRILNGVRAFVRKQDTARAPAAINAIVLAAIAQCRHLTTSAGVAIELAVAEGLPRLVVDATQIEQVLLNLLRNGIEAMDRCEGGRRLRIESGLSADGAEIRVAVSDWGCGLPEEIAADVFEPFFSTKPLGMGLGLAISQGIVESHGGRMSAEANAEAGTTVQFFLPVPRENQLDEA